MDGLRKQLFVCTFILKVALQINSLCWRYKQLFSKSTPTLVVHPYAGGTTLRWWYWCCRL